MAIEFNQRTRHFEDGSVIPQELISARRSPDGVHKYLSGSGFEPGCSIPVCELTAAGPKPGDFHLRDIIGQQQKHIIYLAYHEVYGDVALKMVWPGEAYSHKDQEALCNERNALRRLDHPNLQRYLGSGWTNFDMKNLEGPEKVVVSPRTYIATEYLPGLPVDEVLALEKRAPLRVVGELADQICAGVAHAHQNGVLHGDLKPANIIHSDNDQYVVIDFEVARLIDDSSPVTVETARRGLTASFAAPEQFEGKITKASDQYSLGVTLYKILTEHMPHEGNSIEQIVERKKVSPPADIRNYREDLPAAAADAIMRAIQIAPDDRFQSVSDLRSALSTALS